VSRVGGVSRTRAWRPTGALERRRDAQLCAPALGTACVRVQATGGAPRNRVGRAVNAGPGAHWSIQRAPSRCSRMHVWRHACQGNKRTRRLGRRREAQALRAWRAQARACAASASTGTRARSS